MIWFSLYAFALALSTGFAPSLSSAKPPLPPPSQAELRQEALLAGFGACSDIRQVRSLPGKAGVLGTDFAYDRIFVHIAEYRSCLVAALTDDSPVENVPISVAVRAETVSELAYAILLDAGILEWGECAPPEVSNSESGAVAFYSWLRNPENRENWRECIARVVGTKLCVQADSGDMPWCSLTFFRPAAA